MDNQNIADNTWVKLALDPTDDRGETRSSLAPPLLLDLLDKGMISPEMLLADSPLKISSKSFAWDWFEEDEGYERKAEHTVPVWVHWFLKQRDTEKAAKALMAIIPAQEWIRPFWRNVRPVDILYFYEASNSMDKVLSGLDKDTVEAVRVAEVRQGRVGIKIAHRGLKPKMLQVLAKHGWDVNEKDHQGQCALELVHEEKTFLDLIELGADVKIARQNVKRISSVAKIRQVILKAITDKENSQRDNLPAWEQDVSKLAGILESGVSSGFAKGLEKLTAGYPRPPEGGLEVMGGSIGWAMLKLAATTPNWSSLASKTKSYFKLMEALVSQEDGKWVDLDAPMRGPGVPQGLSNRDGMMVGAFILMTARYNGSSFYPKYQPEGELGEIVSTWAKQHLTDTVVKVSGMEDLKLGELPEKILLGLTAWEEIVRTHYRWSTSPMDRGTKELVEHIDGSNALLIAIRDSAHYAAQTDMDTCLCMEVSDIVNTRNFWPLAVAQKTAVMAQVDQEWVKKSARQFRAGITTSLLTPYGDSNVNEVCQALEWVMEPQYAQQDMEGWKNWAEELTSSNLPLYRVNHYLTEDEQEIASLQLLNHGDDEEDKQELDNTPNKPKGWENQRVAILDVLDRSQSKESMSKVQKHHLMAAKRMVLMAKTWEGVSQELPAPHKPKI